MRIYLPHLHYTVHLKPRHLDKSSPFENVAVTHRVNANTSVIYMDKPKTLSNIGLLAHELVHVLQNICRDRHMDFLKESEHMGYIMQLLMGRMIGLHYK